MIVHRQKRPRYSVQVPLTALIDIVFLLLVYFLLTTNFLVSEGFTVKLPQANAPEAQTEKELTVYVDAEGRPRLGGIELTLDELYQRLEAMIREGEDRMVVIRADRSVILNKAVRVMDVAKAAGARRLLLATEKGD